jgi:hypothetical protein
MVVLLSLALPLAAATLPENHNDREIVQQMLEKAAAQVPKGAIGTVKIGAEPAEPILSFSWGASNSGSISGGTGGGAGKVQFQDLHFVKTVSASSPKLFLKCAQGQHIPTVTLVIANAKGQPYLQITLEDVMISSYQIGGDGSVDATSMTYAAAEYILIGL